MTLTELLILEMKADIIAVYLHMDANLWGEAAAIKAELREALEAIV